MGLGFTGPGPGRGTSGSFASLSSLASLLSFFFSYWLGSVGLGWVRLGLVGFCSVRLGWGWLGVGLDLVGFGRVGLGWIWLGCV